MSDEPTAALPRVIDFHTHVFRDDVAERAIGGMSDAVRSRPHFDGTVRGLLAVMDRAGVSISVLAPVATAARQVESINTWTASKISDRLVAFGAMHPDFRDPEREIARMASLGIKGIKFHTEFQSFHPHDDRLLPIYRAAEEQGMIVLFHAGNDPQYDTAAGSPRVFRELALEYPGLTLVLAHMGGYQMWDEVAAELLGRPVYLDTSQATENLPLAEVAALIRAHGTDRVVVGSDGPWADTAVALAAIRQLGLSAQELEQVLWGNAARLLRLG
jgi:hypothetical protein